MFKINLICVGKIKEEYFTAAVKEYEKRLSRYCCFKITECPEYNSGDVTANLKREGEEILSRIKGAAVLLDVEGKQLSSPELAQYINGYGTRGGEITFIIGGSCGFSPEVYAAVKERISFSRLTFPHQLMRVIACEQIYRAFTIVAGTPYHK